ncbi:esterase E4-like isoform X2 [Planococcus citri]|uniref:esterase E4-like isoform X2 n=1 Tax=Planococcus citri TaxID=170843 RepID=UPI0031F7D486
MPEKVVITINEGKIRGVKEISAHSKTPYYAFYGIPYAEPPVKNLRFKDPVKIKKWANIYDGAEEKKPGCIQISLLGNSEDTLWGDEDCLFNNIFTAKLPCEGEPLRPVIVNIHGGSYNTGTPHTKHYGSPNFIMQHDVVYVNISYRLHILGFLNLGLKECSGNQGIKDILMAFRWIKDNVASFGGDSENITLLGCSTGAAIIHLAMLTPALDRNLFQKAVLMCGYFMNPIAPHLEENKHHGVEVAKSMEYIGDPNDYKRVLNFLKKKPAMELLEHVFSYQSSVLNVIVPFIVPNVFSPTIEPDVIPRNPQKLVHSIMRIPIMVGYCEREAILGFLRGDMRKKTEEYSKTSFCQNCWGWGYNLNRDEIKLINEKVVSFYTKGKSIENAPLTTKVDIQSDICMSDLYDTLVDAIAVDPRSTVFMYSFEFEGVIGTLKEGRNIEEPIKGTFHGSEYCYWNCFFKSPHDKETRKMVDSFTKLVTTFAKTGDPNHKDLPVRWRPYTLEKPCYLRINKSMEMAEGRLFEERLQFWNDIKQAISYSLIAREFLHLPFAYWVI